MDIQTRDGILLRNIPDGTPDEAIKARIAKIRAGGAAPAAPQAAPMQQSSAPGSEPLPPLSQRLGALGMAGARGLMTAGPIGGMAGTSGEALKQGGELLNRGAYRAGGAVTDVLAPHVPPEVAAGAGYAANVGIQAIPTVIGGMVGPGAQKAVTAPFRAAGRAIRNIADPWTKGGIDRAVGRTAVEAAGPKRQALIEALRQNRQIVPGSLPTAGEAAAPVGSAEFSGLQRVVEGRQPSAFFERAGQQEAARRGAIGGIAKDDAAVRAAEAARGSEAKLLYGEARKQIVKADAALTTLLKRPSMDKALARAAELAEESGEKFVLQAGQQAQRVPSRILGPSGAPASVTKIPEKVAEYPVSSLHHIKTALDDMVKNPERFGIGATEARAIESTRRIFVNWLEQKVPAYEVARTAYAKASRPISQMQVGQQLEKSLTAPLGATERPAAYAQAIRAAPQTLKRATGQPRYEALEEVLEPQQMQSVTNVLDDLKRAALHEQLAKAGTEKARDLVGQVSPALPAAGMFNPKYSVLRAISNRLAGRVEGKSLDRLAEAMQDPQLMARLMQNASPAERAALINALSGRTGTALGAGAGGLLGYESGRSP